MKKIIVLKQCPMCGRSPELLHDCYGVSYIRCPNCGLTLVETWADDVNHLCKRWNKRFNEKKQK